MHGCFWPCWQHHSDKLLSKCLKYMFASISWLQAHLLQIRTLLQGRGNTITLVHSDGPYMQTRRGIRRKLKPSGEFGEWIEDATPHNPPPLSHLWLARQKPIERVYSKSDDNRTYRYAKERKKQPRITGNLKATNKTQENGVARRTKSEGS